MAAGAKRVLVPLIKVPLVVVIDSSTASGRSTSSHDVVLLAMVTFLVPTVMALLVIGCGGAGP